MATTACAFNRTRYARINRGGWNRSSQSPPCSCGLSVPALASCSLTNTELDLPTNSRILLQWYDNRENNEVVETSVSHQNIESCVVRKAASFMRSKIRRRRAPRMRPTSCSQPHRPCLAPGQIPPCLGTARRNALDDKRRSRRDPSGAQANGPGIIRRETNVMARQPEYSR